MGKHSILKSVAHNWAHHFLSDCNFVQDTIMVQHLLEAAKACGRATLRIDPLAATIEPEECGTPPVIEGLAHEAEQFKDILTRQGCSMDMIQKVELTITFDLDNVCPSYADIKPGVYYAPRLRMPEAPTYTAQVHLIDDRGREHQALVHEFWHG